MSEILIEVSDGDNTYRVPPNLVDQFNADSCNPYKDHSDEWYDWCDRFDAQWGEYKV